MAGTSAARAVPEPDEPGPDGGRRLRAVGTGAPDPGAADAAGPAAEPGEGWVIRGNPTPEEVAVVVALLAARAAAGPGDRSSRPSRVAARLRRAVRLVLVPGTWLRSAPPAGGPPMADDE